MPLDVYLVKLVEAAVELHPEIPMVLHLDHGADFQTCKDCIDSGFTSVMIDYSSHPFEENIEVSRQVAEYAHERGVVVEAELGTLAGIEDAVSVEAEKAMFTDPDQVEEFVKKTGVDSLAIAIGTSHGAYVKIINENGGALKDAIGIPEDQLREAARGAVCKINIDSDLRLGMTAGIRKHFVEHPDHFDPRQYLTDGRANVKAIVAHKIVEVLGSDNKI